MALASSANIALADSPYFLLRGNADYGGDELLTVPYENGDTETIRAGDGLQLAFGVALDHSARWQSEATVGYRLGGAVGENGALEFDSIPYELLTFYRSPTGKWRAGGGLVYVTNLDLTGTGVVDGFQADFKDSLGFILEADWYLGLKDKKYLKNEKSMAYFGLRGTIIDYEVVQTDETFKGNSVGLVFGLGF